MPLRTRLLERVECFAVGEIADRVDCDREAGLRAAPDDLRKLFLARDLDAGAVEHARRLRAEGSVHERLQVADAHEVVAEAAAHVQVGELVHLVRRQRLPDAEAERAFLAQALPDTERAEPAVLVVHGRDPARNCDADAFACGLDQLVLGRPYVGVAEVPGAFLTEYAGRLAAL